MQTLCVIGTLNVDFEVRVPTLPSPGETLHVSSCTAQHGGRGTDIAIAAARLGAETYLVGSVGTDAHGFDILQALEREGVDLGDFFEGRLVSASSFTAR